MTDREQIETSETGMYLQNFTLRNFRSCIDTTVPLRRKLTLIVGENNSGKSNVIDGLRLLTTPLSGRRTRYFEDDDFSFNSDGPIDLTGEFGGLTDMQKAQYLTATDLNTGNVWYTTRFLTDQDAAPRTRTLHLAGKVQSTDVESEKRQQINHVYLAPLRDAQRELDSASGNRLSAIIKYLTEDKDREDFVEKANESFRELEKHNAVKSTEGRLQEHLSELTDPVRGQHIKLGFDDMKLHRLARSLRLKMAEHEVDVADVAASGLGYANLLYIASVVLELRNAAQSELTLFLVEEPEAHLHPQLQSVLLEYLREQAEEAAKRPDTAGPAGRIQVVATTHSPNLASSVGTENMVVLRTVVRSTDQGDIDTAPGVHRQSRALALAEIELDKDDRRKIDQYLDVTRAELLFTRRLILVEGISEAVLLPVLAKKCVFPDDPSSYRRFRGASIINIGNVDFAPYVKLLLSPIRGIRIADRVVVVTDRDPRLDKPDDEEKARRYNRKEDLEAIAGALEAVNHLVVAEAPHTFEADLMEPFDHNDEVLYRAFRKQKTGHQSDRFWQDEMRGGRTPAATFYKKLTGTERYIGKGEFAHDVATLIEAGGRFACPAYLEHAIRAVMEESDE